MVPQIVSAHLTLIIWKWLYELRISSKKVEKNALIALRTCKRQEIISLSITRYCSSQQQRSKWDTNNLTGSTNFDPNLGDYHPTWSRSKCWVLLHSPVNKCLFYLLRALLTRRNNSLAASSCRGRLRDRCGDAEQCYVGFSMRRLQEQQQQLTTQRQYTIICCLSLISSDHPIYMLFVTLSVFLLIVGCHRVFASLPYQLKYRLLHQSNSPLYCVLIPAYLYQHIYLEINSNIYWRQLFMKKLWILHSSNWFFIYGPYI